VGDAAVEISVYREGIHGDILEEGRIMVMEQERGQVAE
jgi:hypothetical protein